MRTKEELMREWAILKLGYAGGNAGMRDINAFVVMLIEELEGCHNA